MINYREDSDLRGTPRAVISQVQKAVVGKFDIIEQIMMAFLAKGHQKILILCKICTKC